MSFFSGIESCYWSWSRTSWTSSAIMSKECSLRWYHAAFHSGFYPHQTPVAPGFSELNEIKPEKENFISECSFSRFWWEWKPANFSIKLKYSSEVVFEITELSRKRALKDLFSDGLVLDVSQLRRTAAHRPSCFDWDRCRGRGPVWIYCINFKRSLWTYCWLWPSKFSL